MEQCHPRAIELGLDRVRTVAGRLGLMQLPFPLITVGGTNGKGSTVALLEQILLAAGYRTAAYTSPHLIDYTERLRIDGRDSDAASMVRAFEAVEAARGDTSLTYFEFGTLAAAVQARAANVQVGLFEVGLGGRLDAVNLWDADAAIVTTIGTDHKDWLGPDRESIGREKAGIFRAGRPAICGDRDPPASLAQAAHALGAQWLAIGQDFDVRTTDNGFSWQGMGRERHGLPYPAMRGAYQLDNAACALMALAALAERLPLDQQAVRTGLLKAVVPGRFQVLPGRPWRILDVAHNIEAARALAGALRAQPVVGRTLAVVGMLHDKPIRETLAELLPEMDAWHVATVGDTPRAATADELASALAGLGVNDATRHASVTAAWAAALAQASEADRVVAFGSFYTVGAILRALREGEA